MTSNLFYTNFPVNHSFVILFYKLDMHFNVEIITKHVNANSN